MLGFSETRSKTKTLNRLTIQATFCVIKNHLDQLVQKKRIQPATYEMHKLYKYFTDFPDIHHFMFKFLQFYFHFSQIQGFADFLQFSDQVLLFQFFATHRVTFVTFCPGVPESKPQREYGIFGRKNLDRTKHDRA